MNINRRQFVIGTKAYNEQKDNWVTVNIGEELKLSYCKSLPVKKAVSNSGKIFYLLGIAVQTDPKRNNPDKELEESEDSLENIYSSWSGRWVLISHEEIHMDISGLMGCFYITLYNSIWISSSVNILKDILKLDEYDNPSLPEGTMNWYPLPKSSVPEISALLPSQILLLKENSFRPRQLFPPQMCNYSVEEALEIIESSLIEGICQIAKEKGNIWIALSAGYDSRLLLAAALKANINVKTYTMKKKNRWYFFRNIPSTSPVLKADMKLPPLIAEKVGVEHKWIGEQGFSEERFDLFQTHTNKQTIENDRVYFARGQWEWTSNDDTLLLGQVTEIGSGIFYSALPFNNNKFNKSAIRSSFLINSNHLFLGGLEDYGKWLSEYHKLFKEEHVDWRERFYLEQKIAGWLSSLQQGMDLVQGEKVHLINSQRIICALLALPKEEKDEKKHIKKLIKRMSPELAEFPLNPSDSFIYNINKKISRVSTQPKPLSFVFLKLKKKIKGKIMGVY